MKIRQPIISILAHVDHGKTTLLDYIRSSHVAAKEAGGITQHIGATEVPVSTIKSICGDLIKKWNLDIKIPGLLFIDTPGHEAFTLLRRRGGSLADLVILVVDVTEGFKPQTDEVISILKHYKTPFVVAANKIDKLSGWSKCKDCCFADSFKRQRKDVQEALEMKIYQLMGQFGERGFNSNRFDKINDYTKEIAIVPVSGLTGEGVADLLTLVTGISQKFLEKKLEVDSKGEGKGTILEVKEVKGLGTTIDVILYDGIIKKGDELIIGDPTNLIVTKVKALLKVNPMKEMRVEKQFKPTDEVVAASGIKISATGLNNVIAGVPLRALREGSNIEAVKKEIEKEIEDVEIETEDAGVIIRADTIGALEAMVKILNEKSVPIKKAKIGAVTKKDAMALKGVDEKYRLIFAFNVDVMDDAEEEIKNNDIKVIRSEIIYRLIEDYDEYIADLKERKKEEVIASAQRPAKLRILHQFVFRQTKPAIIGFEVMGGVLTEGVKLMKPDGTEVGKVMQIQDKGENVKEAKVGVDVAVSIDGACYGRNIKETDLFLYTIINKKDYKTLMENRRLIAEHEFNVLEEIKDIMLKKDRLWDLV